MMNVLRAINDGVGNGGAMAWPLFGVLSGILTFSTNGLYALGLSSGALFCLVALPLIAIFYYKSIKESHEFSREINRAKKKLKEYLQMLLELESQLNPEGALELTNQFMSSEDKTMQDMLSKLAWMISKEKTKNLDNQLLDRLVNHLWNTTFSRDHSSVSFAKLAIPFAMVAPGIFGTILGGFSGAMGVVIKLSLISGFVGFSSIPVLGWSLIAATIISSLALGMYSSYQAYQHYHNQQTLNNCKEAAKACKRHKKEFKNKDCQQSQSIRALSALGGSTISHSSRPAIPEGLLAVPNITNDDASIEDISTISDFKKNILPGQPVITGCV